MIRRSPTLCGGLLIALLIASAARPVAWAQNSSPNGGTRASTPLMGWNSWDGYGTTVSEADVKANAQWLATHLKEYGWQYVVVDMEWFVTNPIPEGNSKSFQYTLDDKGRYAPAPNRFPSTVQGAGFKPLADYVHSLGLKFGIHILRGIPKAAVDKNMPIEGSTYSARDAAQTSDTCPWNFDNYGLDPSKPAAQAYYDSIARLYAQWEVDLIKVDCIASHPYKGEEIRMLSEALRKTGRPMVLSLSPGPAPREKSEEMSGYAQMWRISDDIWDLWHSDVAYPQGLGDQFANIEKWVGVGRPRAWPDADMLPLGFLGPSPGWGKPRQTRLTRDEQRTLMTLWCIFPSPLMLGGDLPKADSWTTSLLTNRGVLDVDQHSTGNHTVLSNPQAMVLVADAEGSTSRHYVAVFNRSEGPQIYNFSWDDLRIAPHTYNVRNLWEHNDLGDADALFVTLAPHASALYAVDVETESKP